MYTLFNKARKEGLAGIEGDIEEPDEERSVLKISRSSSENHHVRDFVCDTMRMAIIGGASPSISTR
jgi:chemotaxis protein MotA